jgi:prolyl oligopeptidase
MHNAYHRVAIFERDGAHVRDIDMPAMGTIETVSGKRKHNEMFIDFQSYLYPPTVFRYDFDNDALTTWRSPQVDFPLDHYETNQVFYPSKDGTQVSMFITHKKGLTLDGNNPTLLFGYGGFSVSYTPAYHAWTLSWLEMGGVYAVPNLRGGSEYGDEWHRAGMLDKKQNVFDDFIAAGEWLIDNGYTSRKKLAIKGRSNGGLLVGACMIQRPELYGAVICIVPVADMLRFHKFTAGRFWTHEYGDAEENADHFKFMIAYSPLHNVKPGVTYPPILITTADKDDRVVPLHSKKFTATLQANDTGDNPILLRLDLKSGHGFGKPTSKWIDEWADIFAFLHRTLAMES